MAKRTSAGRLLANTDLSLCRCVGLFRRTAQSVFFCGRLSIYILLKLCFIFLHIISNKMNYPWTSAAYSVAVRLSAGGSPRIRQTAILLATISSASKLGIGGQ
jgi:uncharacterized SAM-binding protein YcdF (DUF218 family)